MNPRSIPHSLKSETHSDSKRALKATWLKIDDGEKKEEKEEEKRKKRVKGIYKRNPTESHDREAYTRSVSNPRLDSPEIPKHVSGRGVSSAGLKDGKAGNFYKESEKRKWQRDSNIDLDFAEKIQAFRSLIKSSPQTHKDIPKEEVIKPRSPPNVLTSYRGHLKFNAKSLEGRSSAPDEFQLTYDQDRYRNSTRTVFGLKDSMTINGHGEKMMITKDNDYAGSGKYKIPILNNDKAIHERSLPPRPKYDEDGQTNNFHTVNENKPPAVRVIKRPSVLPETEISKGHHVTSILKHKREEEIRDCTEERSTFSSYHQKEIKQSENSIHRFRDDRRSSETGARLISTKLSSPLTTRPASVNFENHSLHHDTTSQRSHSAIPSNFSGRLHSNVGSVSPSISEQRIRDKDAGMSLQTHLNVLGASLSSLSSIVNGDSSDNEVGRRVYSPPSMSSVVHYGRGDDLSMHYSRITDSHRRGGGRDTHTLNIMGGKHRDFLAKHRDNDYSETGIPKLSLDCQSSYFDRGKEMIRPRSDEYFISEKLRQSERPPNSPRVKQTNVKGIDEDQISLSSNLTDDKRRPASASLISEDLGSISTCTLGSDRLHRVSSTGEASTHNNPNLRHFVRYATRHGTHLSGYSSSNKGAMESEETISNHSPLSSGRLSVNERTHSVNYRNSETETMLSDDSNDDTMVDKEQNALSTKGLNARSSEMMKSSSRPKVISRHKVFDKPTRSGSRGEHQELSPNENQNHRELENGHSINSRESVTTSTDRKRNVKRLPMSPRQSDFQSDSTDNTHDTKRSHSERSQTVLGLCSTKESNKKLAILPSKYSVKNSVHSQRPHSAFESRDKTNIKKIIGKDLLKHNAKQSETEKLRGSGSALRLMKKVQNLHEEVDRRLNSDANIAHSVTSSLTDLFEKVRDGDDDEEFEIIQTSGKSEHNRGKSSGTNRVNDGNKIRGRVIIRRKDLSGEKNKVDYDYDSHGERFSAVRSGVVAASTPRNGNSLRKPDVGAHHSSHLPSKIDAQIFRNGTRDYNENTNTQDNHTSDSKSSSLSRNLRKILGAHEYLTHKFPSNESRVLRKTSKESLREEFDDDKDEDDTINDDSYRKDKVNAYSESLEWNENRRKVMSPLIARLANVDLSSRHVTQDIGHHVIDIHKIGSGRASPADVLMGYLDDPNTVRLLQRLYQADPADREILMIKVLYFKTWLHFSTTSKQRRLKKQALSERADTFCYQRILALHFITWERHARYSQNVRHASGLYRRHMLSKGFKALQWSVSHSRHCRELIQSKYRLLTTRASFYKWRNRAVKQRRERMEHTMKRWKQFVTEAHKIRHMQDVMDRNIMEKVYSRWRKCYNKHMKHRMAFNYFRHTLCKHALSTWSAFVYTCKQKKEKYLSAVCQYQNNLIKTTFFQMVFAYKKSKRARTHFRHQKLNEVFWSWRQASQICRNERKQDVLLSGEHCRMQRLRNSFRQWKQRILLCKADTHANSHLYRKVFNRWVQSYHEKFTRRQEIEVALERNKLHRALLTWRRNVVQIKRRHKQAVILLETCSLRITLKTWRQYVSTQIGMRNKVKLHQKDQEKKKMNFWFSLWFNKYEEKMYAKKKQVFWSENCARKLSRHWRHVCRIRSLERKLEESQPERELRFIQTIFTRWQMCLEKRRQEEEEAEHMWKNLELKNLGKSLQMWKTATQKQLMIKPLMRQREQRTVKECFQNWCKYTHSIVDCRKSKTDFVKTRMRKYFTSWKRRYASHLVEKQIKRQFSQGLLMCCFEEWKLLVQHKRRGQDFRHKRLVTKMFLFWKQSAAAQITKRTVLKEEKTHNTELKRKSFVTWWENVQEQKASAELCVTDFASVRERKTVVNAFYEWKHLLHSTLIARAYQKVFNQRLVLTMLLEWHRQVKSDVGDAVSLFQERIGLSQSEVKPCRESTPMKEVWPGSPGQESEFGTCDYIDKDVDMNSSVFGSLSSSYNAGLFGRFLEDNSSIDSDTDRSFLLSGGLQDSANYHLNRCNKMREIVTTSVWRLQHWPICVVFQQWQEFTARQIQLKNAANQIRSTVDTLDTAMAFRQWRIMHMRMKTAREHWDSQLLSSKFAVLRHYTNHCRHVKRLASCSEQHLRMKVFCQYFPIWLRKTQKQRREKHVVTLWTSSTAEELELLPLENQLTRKLNNKSQRLCFSLWILKVSHIQKIRLVYETNLLQWVFNAWGEWALYRQNLVKKSMTMVCGRRTRMAFKRWRDKYHQSRQTEILYAQAWQNYQIQILVQWQQWAKASRQHRSISKYFGNQRSLNMLKTHFTTWKSLTNKTRMIQNSQRSLLLLSVIREWRQVVQDSKTKRHITIQFQIRSYTLLVKRLFLHWHGAMVHQRNVKEEKIQKAEHTALYFARLWRKKCQKSRGKQLENIFQSRKVTIYLQTWLLRLKSIQLLQDRLDIWQKKKNSQVLKRYLQTWVLNLKENQISRDYTSKFLCSIVYEWRIFTKESRDRRRRGLALTKALQERNLHVYFQFWVAITKVKVSVRFNAETRLQLRIMRSWHTYAKNRNYLRQLQAHFTQKVNTRILTDAFTKMQWRIEYCSHLQEVADKIVHDRVRATLTAVLVVWKQRLDLILAARCYGGILVVRVVRQWHRFVHKCKAERLKEQEDHLKAVNFDCTSICKRAFAGFKELVLVSKMVAKRRQRLCNKYALIWKTQVDLQISAMEMEWDILCWKTWQKWRREYTRRQAAKKVEKSNNRHTMSQTFKAWRKLCKSSKEIDYFQNLTPRTEKRSSISSQLPVPIGRGHYVSPTFSPSSSTSSLSSYH